MPEKNEKGTISPGERIVLTESIKALHVMVVSVMADITAVRRTLLVNADQFQEYESQLKLANEIAKPLLDEAIKSYDMQLKNAVKTEKPKRKARRR
jgi:hypothetical protein